MTLKIWFLKIKIIIFNEIELVFQGFKQPIVHYSCHTPCVTFKKNIFITNK